MTDASDLVVEADAERWDQARDSDAETALADPGSGAIYRWCIGQSAVPASLVLDPIDLISLSTSTLYDVVVEWRLRPVGGSCGGAGSYAIQRRTISSVTSLTPFAVQPTGNISVPAGVTEGNWAFCARVDPDDAVSETDPNDNVVLSDDRVIEIGTYPDPGLCP